MSRKMYDRLVTFLGAALLMCIAGIIVLLVVGKPVDDILKQTTGMLVTGLLGLMVNAPPSPDDPPQPVNVVNDRRDPVAVDPV